MCCLLTWAVVGLSTWVDVLAVRALLKHRAGPLWWAGLAVLVAVGSGVGVWCGFFCKYRFSDKLRVFSFPMPAAFFRWEDGDWVDYVTPSPYGIAIALLNVVSITLVSVLPLSATFLLRKKEEARAT